ncbi:DUF2155 domain-containing protein [Bradyrhizobium sp. KBS0727]|uniref:DUF2155 domain-containing protein n=1 Tax=unclassified Bradyrhizobium TaxID=2631580 RepID=UPI00110E1E25|nr:MULTISPECIES: DUF2155 domain-containing protein [unclassified Bradyrhizobium]QDW39141.1 DUF2155 domain-containing protein [Bradyrhizobium sp. KBS0725]QDW45744.1 DUF2155 domain-containing protein [Bradyrhizobium sp. KBS0727]
MFRTIALTGFAALVAASTISLAPPARAQIGNIFSDPAPRPPGAIPRGNQPPQQTPDDDEEVPELPRGRLLPTPNRPPPGQGVPAPGSVQSQPLAPPPGTTVIPPNTAPGIAVAPPQPGAPAVANAPPSANPLPGPGQRQPKSVPGAPATLQPGDEVVSEPPATKITNKKASFSGLDKITGRIINFDEDIGETVQFGALRVKTDACYTRPSTEAANTDAFVEVDEITLQGEVKRIFSGWMYAASPGLHGVEHPIYDIWLTDCKGPDQTIVSAQPDLPKPPPPPPVAQKRPAPPKQAAPRPSAPPQPQFQQQPPPPPPQQRPGGLFGGLFGNN